MTTNLVAGGLLSSALGHPVTEKLTKTNYTLWKLQVLPAIRGAQLTGLIDGSKAAPAMEIEGTDKAKEPNPAYATWLAQDQQVFGYIVNSLSKEMMKQVSHCNTSASLWKALEELCASQTRARAVNTRIALATTKKGTMSIDEYVGKMKAYADELAAAGKALDDEELISYIITGLDLDYNPVISTALGRVDPISVTEFTSQLLAFEQRLNLYQGSSSSSSFSANVASRGRGGGRMFRGRGARGRGNGGRGRGNFNNNSSSGKQKVQCQICKKVGVHTASECWHRFDENFVPEDKSINVANYGEYGVDSNWYTDTGASDHVTGEMDKMVIRDRYHGGDQVHTANGSGMDIEHIGHVICHAPGRKIHLKNVLHVPSAAKNLVSVHKLAADNNAYLEFHPNFFLIKDRITKKILLEGTCRGGLYPMPAAAFKNKQAFAASSSLPSLEMWHSRLGHPSFDVVQQVLSSNKLSCSSYSRETIVCDSCQMAKSHQLPYQRSLSKSMSPLELVHSDVWGHAIDSFGNYKYYVSFIDDYSKFTWIYLLKHKSEVFDKFHEFQQLAERQLNKKNPSHPI